jgi:hypothetical protein
MDEAAADAFIRDSLSRLTEKDHAFSVECLGSDWDVYRLTAAGRRWTTAFRIKNGQLEVGVFMVGELTRDEIVFRLQTGSD